MYVFKFGEKKIINVVFEEKEKSFNYYIWLKLL